MSSLRMVKIVRRRPASYVLFGPGGQASLGPVDGDTSTEDDTSTPDTGGSIASDDDPDISTPNDNTTQQIALQPTPTAKNTTPAAAAAEASVTPDPTSSPRPSIITQQQSPTAVIPPQSTPTPAQPEATTVVQVRPVITTAMHILHPVDNPATVSISMEAATVLSPNKPTTTNTGSSTTSVLMPSWSAPSSASSNNNNNTSGAFHTVPLVLGIIVGSVIGIAAIGATLSWLLRMRRREGGLCGCGGDKHDDGEMEKWGAYENQTPDLFKEKTFDSGAMSSAAGDWEGKVSQSSLGTYPATPHPVVYGASAAYGPVTPILRTIPHLPFTQSSHSLGGEGPYFTTRPTPAHLPTSESFPALSNPHPVISDSPIQHAPTPGMLTVANFAPGDITDSSQQGSGSPWLSSPPSHVTLPQRPWTASFTPYLGDEHYRPGMAPLSPLPEDFGTPRGESDRPRFMAVQGEELPVPWQPLKVRSKSQSTASSDSRKSSMRSAAPRLPTPPAMANAETDGGWAASFKSNIFAALGAVSNMRQTPSSAHLEGMAVVPPSAPLSDRLTPAVPRVRRAAAAGGTMKRARAGEEDEGQSSESMCSGMSSGSRSKTTRMRHVGSKSSCADTVASRLYRNVQRENVQHDVDIGVNRSYSQYSCSSGYTTDKGEEADGENEQQDILKMYALPSEAVGVNRKSSRFGWTGRRSKRVPPSNS